jgi:Fe-S-cluster-containing dehydrogenase component
MGISRRKFFSIGGACVLGASVIPIADALADNKQTYLPNANALSAKRWALVIDTNKCVEGCRDCIDACHLTHNVPSLDEEKREVKWLWTDSFEAAFPHQKHDYNVSDATRNKPHLLLCNHCDNPPCVRVCPTKATFKRADGIVAMDYHRCIGCRYCMAACPYGARSFNFKDPRPYIDELNEDYPARTKGVVEKCNLCDHRLAEGLPPACVEACKYGAILFGDLDDPNSDVRKALAANYNIQRKPDLGTQPKVYYIV